MACMDYSFPVIHQKRMQDIKCKMKCDMTLCNIKCNMTLCCTKCNMRVYVEYQLKKLRLNTKERRGKDYQFMADSSNMRDSRSHGRNSKTGDALSGLGSDSTNCLMKQIRILRM